MKSMRSGASASDFELPGTLILNTARTLREHRAKRQHITRARTA
jgi:hypothetical protein